MSFGFGFGLPRLAPIGGVSPLDSLTAAAAYSTRRLRTAYTGPALRVRRSIDNVETDIGFTAGDLDTEALLAHVGSQNLLLRSEQFDFMVWEGLVNSAETIAANSVIAPDGTQTAERCTVLSSGSGRFQQITLAAAGQITFSVHIKAGSTGTWARIGIIDTATTINQARCWVNMLTGALGTVSINGSGYSGVTASSTPVGDGWYRISVTATCTATAITMLLTAADADNATTRTIGHNRILWGAQLNTGATAQPYSATTNVVRTGDGFISTWYDQSGNGLNATQATAANQPRIVSSGVVNTENGKPALLFDGVNDTLSTAASTMGIGNTGSMNVVARAPTGASMGIVGFEDLSNRLGFFVTGTPQLRWNGLIGTVGANGAAIASNVLRVLSGTTASGSQSSYNNGSLDASGVAATSNLASSPFIIGNMLPGATLSYLNGEISEVIVFPSALSTTDRQILERNQGAYFEITVA